MKNTLIAGGLGAVLLLGACQKNEAIEPDPAKVSMQISSPLPGQVYRSGDTVRLRAEVRYPGQLHGYELRLVDSATGTVVHDIARHTHADSFSVDAYWVSAAVRPATVKLILTASIDHESNEGRSEFSFYVRP